MLERGTIVAGYRVDGVLGDGGMAVVYRATQLSLRREVALKLLSSDLGDDPAFRMRFKREGQLQAALDHEHIVPVYEAGEAEQGLFLAMRMIDGPTLKDLILSGELDPRRSVRLLAQVAHALDAAHGAGLIHRDIKPQNILIGRGDHAFLADFGLIKAPEEVTLTGTGQFIGTIDYVAPEQIRGEVATPASDCYALAGVLYECLTREVPFPRPNEAATLHSHVIAPAPRVTDRRPELPVAMDEVVARGMAKDPAARPASATELIMAGVRALATAPSQAPAAPAPGAALATGAGGGATRVRDGSAASDASSTPALERAHDSARDRVPLIDGGVRLVPERGAPLTDGGARPVSEPAGARDVRSPPAESAASVQSAAIPPRPRVAPPPLRPALTASAAGRRPAARGALAALALGVAAAVAGFLIGHSGASEPGYNNSAAVDGIQLRYPSSWQLSDASFVVPGLRLADPLVLMRTPNTRGLIAGTVSDAAGPTLLSHSFRAGVQGELPLAQPVRLGQVEAERYSGVRVHGLPGALTLYVTPTSGGVATVACWSATAPDSAFQSDCGRLAATLRLVGLRP